MSSMNQKPPKKARTRNLLVIVPTVQEAAQLQRFLVPGSRAVAPGMKLSGGRLHEELSLHDITSPVEEEWYNKTVAPRLYPWLEGEDGE